MKWYWWVLGTIGFFVVSRGVNNYRSSHRPSDGKGFLTWEQALKGYLGMGTYPAVQMLAPGQMVNLPAGATLSPTNGAGGVSITYDKL